MGHLGLGTNLLGSRRVATVLLRPVGGSSVGQASEPTMTSNSHDVWRERGGVMLLSRTSSGGYDAGRGVDGGAWNWTMYPRAGRAFNRPGSLKVPLHMTSGTLGFESFEAAARWAREHLDIAGWKRDKHGGYHEDVSGTDVPCDREVSRSWGRVSAWGRCDNKRKAGQGACGLHLGADERAIKKGQVAREKRERSEAGERIAKDGVSALAEIEVKARAYYHQAHRFEDSGYTGEVRVHAEDVLALVREVQELRALREIM